MYARTQSKPPVLTALLCIWCVMVFAAINLDRSGDWESLAKWGYFPEADLYRGHFWGLVTSAFVHIEPLHLIFNLYWVWILGGAFERTLGPLALAAFVVFSAFISSGLQLGSEGAGIGLSGVGYALFGFAYVTRTRYPELARVCNDQTARMFILWFFICIIATYAKIMHIANVAHFTGFLVGAAFGGTLVWPKRSLALNAALLLMAVGAVVPLYYNPLSADWVDEKAYQALTKKDYVNAENYLLRSLSMKGDPSWAWENLANVYSIQNRPADYKMAMKELKDTDSEAYDRLVKEHGPPK